jgi:hypothetical protein
MNCCRKCGDPDCNFGCFDTSERDATPEACETCGARRDPETGWCPHTDAECDRRAGLRESPPSEPEAYSPLANDYVRACVRSERERIIGIIDPLYQSWLKRHPCNEKVQWHVTNYLFELKHEIRGGQHE